MSMENITKNLQLFLTEGFKIHLLYQNANKLKASVQNLL